MLKAKRDFLRVEDWPAEEIREVLALATRVKRGEILGGLERKLLALVFLDPSLRTRASFEAAMFLHGGRAVALEPGRTSWALETEPDIVMDGAGVEHLIEAARVLGRYVDVVGVRAFPRGDDWEQTREDRVLADFARYCEKPIINLESGRRHPCQELADALTLQEQLGDPRARRFTLMWAWHPKALPTAVPASAALAAARLGMNVTIARPEGYDLDPDDTALIRQLAAANGGALQVTSDLDAALAETEVVYVKSWGALGEFGKPEAEGLLRAGYRDWRCTTERLRGTKDGRGRVMHCLPVRRNVEIDGAVLDGPNSIVTDQAENRLHAQRALLLRLLGAA